MKPVAGRKEASSRGFGNTKQGRGLTTRDDKLAITYCDAAVLRAITLTPSNRGDPINTKATCPGVATVAVSERKPAKSVDRVADYS